MEKFKLWVLNNLEGICTFVVSALVAIVSSVVFLHTTEGITSVAAAGCGFFSGLFLTALMGVWNFVFYNKFYLKNILAGAFGAILGFIVALILL